jgi:hypothetical protein
MQNKPNLLDSQMNVSSVLTKDYGNVHLCKGWKNKANQSQTEPTSKPALSAPKIPPISPFFSNSGEGQGPWNAGARLLFSVMV